MAQPDGTYYPINFDPRADGKHSNHALEFKLTGGSGTSTLNFLGTLEDSPVLANAIDITNATLGVANFQATTGTTARAQVSTGNFRAYTRVWVKVVLATSGADDADFENRMGTPGYYTWGDK